MPRGVYGLAVSAAGSSRHDEEAGPIVQDPTLTQPVTSSTVRAVHAPSAAPAGPTLDTANPVGDASLSFSCLSMSGEQQGSTPPSSSSGFGRPSNNSPYAFHDSTTSPSMVSSRSHSYGRPGEEQLLSPPGYSQSGQSSHNPYATAQDPSRGPSGSGGLPGALQAGRPHGASSASQQSAPILPPISTHHASGHGPGSARPPGSGGTHSYSRSSPAVGVPATDATGAATPTRGQHGGSGAPPTPLATVYSPLGLADIRPRADSGAGEGPGSATPFVDAEVEPGNSQYLAPWPVYSMDWCKWPVPGHVTDTAGKLAIGSYLEDSHNYVRGPLGRYC